MKTFALLMFLTLVNWSPALASGGHEADSRPMTPQEQSGWKQTITTLFQALPPAPQGYARVVKPSREELLGWSRVTDDANLPTYVETIRLDVTYSLTPEALEEQRQRQQAAILGELAPDPALVEEEQRLKALKKAAKKTKDAGEVARIQTQLDEVKTKLRQEHDRKMEEYMSPAAMRARAQYEQADASVESFTLTVAVNDPSVHLEHFLAADPVSTDGTLAVKDNAYGYTCFLRAFGDYTVDRGGTYGRLTFAPQARQPLRCRAAYAMATVQNEERPKALARAVMETLDGALLSSLWK